MQDEQNDEREVLLSIYEGDSSFKQLSPKVFQYKYGEDSDSRSFLLEISWGENYPSEIPSINMDTFYNKHLLPDVRNHIADEVKKEAENNVGMGMTYTLFEWVKERVDELIVAQPESIAEAVSSKLTLSETPDTESSSIAAAPKVRKEAMSKAQKRKQWDRLDKGEKPRGHDWVDVVKHLSQTGYHKESSDQATTTVSSGN
ncbi:RWD domain-containing protein 4 [Neocloeon triangulifer]|uniref:RWD domain-containing protein 4 n=1 Tax=Neocloeon triangulifer TaxID=2078957 RepID=UPI00286ECE41|nr:RWD domain-containing protein 4 [Neocloeon triangulifer]